MRPTPHLFNYQRFPLEDLLDKWYTYHDEESVNAAHYMYGKDEAFSILSEVQLLCHKAEEWFTRRNQLFDNGEKSNHKEPVWPVPNFDKRCDALRKKLPSPGFWNALWWKENQHAELWTEIGELVHDLKEFGWAPLEHRLPKYHLRKRKWEWVVAESSAPTSATESTLSVSEASFTESYEKKNASLEETAHVEGDTATEDDSSDAEETTPIGPVN